ncbi:MAG: TonB-dependent receptor [Bacteroidales bacterium]|nr:TonB-dependent receptor [Bacteroidales bacterium]
MIKYFLAATCILLLHLFSYSQKHTISGYVENAESGEKLAGAVVYIADAVNLGTMANAYGFYSITVPDMKVKLTASYIGYATQVVEFNLTKDTLIIFSLTAANEIEEVEIFGRKTEAEKTEMGKIDISIKTIKTIPALLGEVDVLKAIQLLPGIQSGTEGTSGFYVRGGGPDQNLILIDGVPVYNANHLFGFFSIFNADAISDVSITKGGFPARYGGRLSSVLDIRMKEGNIKKISGTASIGLISSKFMLEGPIIKDKTSFLISARRTYIDILSWPIQKIYMNKQEEGTKSRSGYYFWDINAKVNHKFSDKDRIYLSVYTGKDKAYANIEDAWEEYKDEFKSNLNWGNITSAFRWNHILGKKLFSNVILSYSRYKFGIEMSEKSTNTNTDEFEEFAFGYSSGIEDYAGKIDFDYNPSPNHNIKFGANYIYHTFSPGIQAMKFDSNEENLHIDTTFGNSNIYASEYSVYVEDEISIFKNFKANIGFHYSGFYVSDTLYQSYQPRISARYLITPKWSVKAAYTEMAQYLHLLTNTSIGMPTDLWIPVTDNIKPQKSTQYAFGSAYSINGYDISIEAYYKTMSNMIEYKEGASFFGGFGEEGESERVWENKIETDGKGTSYGIELLIKKNVGKTTGWIGYTLSKTDRQFSNISFGEWYPYTYDRRHDIGIVITHKFNDRIDIGATWVFGTGNATTLALERYQALSPVSSFYGEMYFEEVTLEHIEERNNFRMPAYHRFDLGVNFRKQKKHGKRTWSVGAYNVYNRKNPFFLRFGRDDNGDRALFQYSLFPIIPSVSYRFDF